MIEYKFRAWNKVHKEIVNWEQYKDKMVSNDFEDDDLIIMQWTGMKDNHGKDIYLGDICELSSDVFYSNSYFSIAEYWKMICVVKFDSYMYLFREIEDKYKEICFLEICEGDINVEVIGNMCENPKLLEVQE